MRSRLYGRISWGVLILLFLAAIGIFTLVLTRTGLENRRDKLKKAVTYLKSEYRFATVKILSQSEDSIRFELQFYNQDGGIAATTTETMKGSEVFLESSVAVIKAEDMTRALVFPLRVYTEKVPPSEGISLAGIVAPASYPLLYATSDPELQKTVSRIFKSVISNGSLTNQDDSEMVSVVLQMDTVLHPKFLDNARSGKTFAYTVHPDGGMEVEEVK